MSKDFWNIEEHVFGEDASIHEGDEVYYHPLSKEPPKPETFAVRAIGEIPSCNEQVAWLYGIRGCVSFSHLSKKRNPVDAEHH